MRVSVPTDEMTIAELKRLDVSHADAYRAGAAALIAEASGEFVFEDGKGWETIVTPINGIPTRFSARTLEAGANYTIYFTDSRRWVMVARMDDIRNDIVLNEASAMDLAYKAVDMTTARELDFTMRRGANGANISADQDDTGAMLQKVFDLSERLAERLAELYVRDVRW